MDISLQAFDTNDPKNLGRPKYFNIDQYISIVEQLVISDEVERALLLLDNLPAFYRDNVPINVMKLRAYIQKKLCTPMAYIEDHSHIKETRNLIALSKDEINETLMDYIGRAFLIKGFVKKLNEEGKEPYIVECAPGSYWIPIGLKKNDCKFKYYGPSLNKEHEKYAHNYLLGTWYYVDPGTEIRTWVEPTIFTCFELIEHLHEPDEILHNYLKHNIEFNHIFLSTPKYCINGGNPDWHNGDLGHLRAYTPNEFTSFAIKNWPLYKWTLYDHPTMILHGEKV